MANSEERQQLLEVGAWDDEGDSADMCAGKFLLVSMGGPAEGLACADPGARTPIGASRNYCLKLTQFETKLAFNVYEDTAIDIKSSDRRICQLCLQTQS